ncbi:translation factor Sua5 [Roseivivax halodurans JCM 10272]|uniref:Threonylcarbamoyl-AMP synthase n=1 Tax=Roseivivax halodurans JCM 10272 TaxID=1449350 RepID=X7ELC7_9RHOB|nr:L-threonylcarbamoyladenylate synthase [Roseivivax halodurans]ETX15966.1 translation factor Sua5 [Roseivivax halodurans JCM 10272]
MTDITTERLPADPTGFARAAELWRAGACVAFPTETVYGLGADATSDDAVTGIYTAKDRPRFNPLIVHLPDLDAVKALVEWSDEADRIASVFWPGPLTLVLPLKEGAGVSKLVTAGLDTLAVRMPAHPVARALLTEVGRPIAAPSANRSGRISPTTADHVAASLDGRIAAIVEGGASEVGLESTILGLAGDPTLLRPGGLPVEALEEALGGPLIRRAANAAISAPGQTASHYAPEAHMRLNATDWREGEARLGFGPVECDLNLSASGDLREAAAMLFAHLHALDARGAGTIAVSPIPDRGLGAAINDRLMRAAAPRG